MKVKMTLASLSRALSKFIRVVTVARAKTIENGIAKNVTNPILPSVQQRLSLNNVGLKYLTTSAMDVDTTTTEPEFAKAKTSMWWDVENCEVPKGCDGHEIAQNIKSVLEKENYCGPLTIYAYGDTNQIPSSVQEALSSTGVSLSHVPPGFKDGSDMKIIVDIMLWAMENQAPANIMLISGDGDFSYLLHQLGMKRYRILLARPQSASHFLTDAAKTVFLWRSIVSGSSEVPKQAEPGKRVNTDLVLKSKSSQRSCETCKVVCKSLADYESHLSSKKHKKKVHYPTGGSEEHNLGRRHINKRKAQAG